MHTMHTGLNPFTYVSAKSMYVGILCPMKAAKGCAFVGLKSAFITKSSQ